MPLKTVHRLQTTVVEENASWACCVCGKVPEDMGTPHWRPSGFHLIKLSGGYADEFPPDSATLQIVACEDCLKAWVATFKHPDVIRNGWMYDTRKVRYSETGEWMQVRMGRWVWPLDQEEPPNMPEEEYDEDADPLDGLIPDANVMWQHFKGEHYLTVGMAYRHPDKTPLVIYRALYGDSELWARPADMWDDYIEREGYSGPRFEHRGFLPRK